MDNIDRGGEGRMRKDKWSEEPTEGGREPPGLAAARGGIERGERKWREKQKEMFFGFFGRADETALKTRFEL
ncbi:hypothetical protein L484_027494 [Morus notabilis]|uniref:Uncharacterized protein n=1 Tax=Morus notabilis TaxID=981085 RepID=W9S8T5_9ROSA|nr:hypothetical protein L484_027494 [Morus notabilis]